MLLGRAAARFVFAHLVGDLGGQDVEQLVVERSVRAFICALCVLPDAGVSGHLDVVVREPLAYAINHGVAGGPHLDLLASVCALVVLAGGDVKERAFVELVDAIVDGAAHLPVENSLGCEEPYKHWTCPGRQGA